MRLEQAKKIQRAVNRLLSDSESQYIVVDNAIIMKQEGDIVIRLENVLHP